MDVGRLFQDTSVLFRVYTGANSCGTFSSGQETGAGHVSGAFDEIALFLIKP